MYRVWVLAQTSVVRRLIVIFCLVTLPSPSPVPEALAADAQWLTPPDGATVSGDLVLRVKAPRTAATVAFFVDAVPIARDTASAPWTATWATAAVGDGTHVLTAVAHGRDGTVVGQASSTVAVANHTPPRQPWPIRAAFYYPWFPENWTQQGSYPFTNYRPSLGYYGSEDPTVIAEHIKGMQYGHIEAGIASWWGQGSPTDRRLAALLQAAAGTGFRWAIYYEVEGYIDPIAPNIQADLAYIREHYASDPAYLRVDGWFVVFVYGGDSDSCAMAERWRQASAADVYLVLKAFPGYQACTSQPESWHQYKPTTAEDHQPGYSFTISPGFWGQYCQ